MGARLTRAEIVPGCWDADLDAHPDDAYDWTDPGTGYDCRIRRDMATWTYSGYVTVPEGHPDRSRTVREIESAVHVHGGLTFGESGTFGFDVHHPNLGDRSPGCETNLARNPSLYVNGGQTTYRYWTFEETKKEVEGMAVRFLERA